MEFNINMYWMLNKYEVDKQLNIIRYKKKNTKITIKLT